VVPIEISVGGEAVPTLLSVCWTLVALATSPRRRGVMEELVDVTQRDARIEAALRGLEAIELAVIVGATFSDADVYLDGRAFVDCTFVRCRLVAAIGHFTFGGHTSFRETGFGALEPGASVVNLSRDFSSAPVSPRGEIPRGGQDKTH